MKSICMSTFLLALLVAPPAALGEQHEQHEQRQEFFNMGARIGAVEGALTADASCEVAGQAIAQGLRVLYGGPRPVPSRDRPKETIAADQNIAANERRLAKALGDYAREGNCPKEQARALDLSLGIMEMNEIAVAVGRKTINCGAGAPCEDLVPFLNEQTGHEEQGDPRAILKPGFFLKLRSPFVPTGHITGWDEDLFQTAPIGRGKCVAIFKETRGLMLRLVLLRIDVVRDPWATAMLARGTKIPIFALEWIPSQYGKTWSICNNGKGGLETTVSQRVKQDIALTYFWRYFGHAGCCKHR